LDRCLSIMYAWDTDVYRSNCHDFKVNVANFYLECTLSSTHTEARPKYRVNKTEFLGHLYTT